MKSLMKFIQNKFSKIMVVSAIAFFSAIVPLSSTAFAQAGANQAPTNVSASAAQAIQAQNTITADVDVVVQNLASLLATFVRLLNYLLWPILFMIGGLMDNSLIFGPGVEDRLFLIWSQIRNLINLLFAVALIGVAIYNVLGLSRDGNYALKTFLPSMVVTLVLVNFSFFGVRLALDVANVATTAVFALPNAVEQSFSEDRVLKIESAICNNSSLQGVTTSTDPRVTDIQNATQAVSQVTSQLCNGGILSENGRAQFTSLDKNNVGLVMAISFNRIADILDPSELTTSNPSFINLAVNLGIVLVLQIVYLSAFFALFAVLVARIIAMWIVTIASPLLVLKLGMSKAKLPGMGFLDSFDFENMFIKHATAPIKIGLAMSIGYMMLDVFQTVGSPSVYFPLGDDFTNVFSGVGTINELFISIAAIAIVWKVSFEAADGTFAESITNKYKNWAEGIGRSVRGLVIQKTPILPLANGDGEKPKALSLGQIINAPNKMIDKAMSSNSSSGSSNTKNDIFTRESSPGVILKTGDISSMNKKQTELLAKGIAASDHAAFADKFRNVNKDRVVRTLNKIKSEGVLVNNASNIQPTINAINALGNDQGDEALRLARELLKNEYRTRSGDFIDRDYKAAVEKYKEDLNKSDE